LTATRRNVRLISRSGVDHTERFVDIAAAIRRLPARTLILDGEVCVFDQTLGLVSHMRLLTDPPADANVTPPLFMTFDCLYGRGKHVRRWSLKDRRKVMEDEIEGSPVSRPGACQTMAWRHGAWCSATCAYIFWPME
jgi:bifunctional non-homologous end joining protein LigD